MEESDEVAALLRRYYAAASVARGPIEARLLAVIEPRIRRTLRSGCRANEEIEDLWSEFCLRMVPILRNGASAEQTDSYVGKAVKVARNVIRDTQRRDNPWYVFKLRVKYLVTDPHRRHGLARWAREGQFLIGRVPQYGRPFEPTPAYAAFCRDASDYLRETFPDRSPSDERAVPLSELMLTLLDWVRTPLYEHPCIRHLAHLRGIQKIAVASLDAPLPGTESRLAETLAAPLPERENIDWERCWNELLTFSTTLRRIVLLSLDPPLLALLTGLPDPTTRLQEALECSAETLRRWMTQIPFDDEQLAQELSIPKASLQTFRSRARERLRKRCVVGTTGGTDRGGQEA